MKRLLTFALIGALAILVLVPVGMADQLTGGSMTFKYQLDSTSATLPRVDTTAYYKLLDSISSGNRPFLTDISQTRTKLGGWFVLSYSKFDTNSGGAVPDTSKDSLWVDIITQDPSGTPSKVVWSSSKISAIHTTANIAATDYVPFTIASDSTLYGSLYFRVRAKVTDSVGVSLSTGIHYRLQLKMWGSE